MTIPEIRERLLQLADEHDIGELRHLARNLRRRPAVRKADTQSQPMTPLLAMAIRTYVYRHPEKTQAAIAAAFNVNPGRISEALRGKRA